MDKLVLKPLLTGRFFLILAVFLIFANQATIQAKEEKVVVLYTGQAHSALYPCNCPFHPEGGVARRLTRIKESRKLYPYLILLDGGNMFASGVYDEQSRGFALDKKRTEIYLKAFNLMGYDAVAVGEDEFNFGKDFLAETIKNTKTKFLSCNLQFERVLPFIIREYFGTKIAIVGVTGFKRMVLANIGIFDPKNSLADTIRKLKAQNVKFIILLSQLGEDIDMQLAKEMPDINIIISGKGSLTKEPATLVGPVLIARPEYESRRIGKIELIFSDGSVRYDKNLVELSLSDQVKDDADILSFLPRCFKDSDCNRGGFNIAGSCRNPGEELAKCEYSQMQKVK